MRWWAVAFVGVSVGFGCLSAPPPLPGAAGSTGDETTGGTGGTESTEPEADTGTGAIEGDSSDGGTTDPFGAVCGDGSVEGDEECDLGPQNGQGDYCTSECRANVCGDGYLGPGEACDDGNDSNDDQCTTECGLASCGDGSVQAGEECDEGADNSETGSCLPSCIQASCGDLFINEGVEVCDGVNTGGRTCADQGFDRGVLACADDCSSFDTTNCHECGNGIIEPNEVCDAPEFGGQSCADYAPMGTTPSGGALSCDDACTAIGTDPCTYCRDGVAEGSEDCDEGDLNGHTCDTLLGVDWIGRLYCNDACEFDTEECCLPGGVPCMNNADCCTGVCGGLCLEL